MKKKLTFAVLVSCLMLTLVGCSDAIPDMSDQEMSMVTNYAADLLLKYNPKYQSKFLDDNELAAEEELQRQIQEEADRIAREEAEKAAKKAEKEAQEAQEAQAQTGGSADQVLNIDPASYLGYDSFSVSCNGISYVNTYPQSGGDMFFAMNASPTCKLAVVSLYVTNQSSENASLDIFDKQAKFKISINKGTYHSIASSYLEDDFSMYTGEFAPNETRKLMLLVDLPEDECVDVSSIDMSIKYDGETIKTNIY